MFQNESQPGGGNTKPFDPSKTTGDRAPEISNYKLPHTPVSVFTLPALGIQCRVGGHEHGQLAPPRNQRPFHRRAQPEVVGGGKSHRPNSLRPSLAAGTGSRHPGSQGPGRQGRATFRSVGAGTLSDSAPQRDRPQVRL